MPVTQVESRGLRLPILQGVLPIKGWQVPAGFIAGFTLAVPEVMGLVLAVYTRCVKGPGPGRGAPLIHCCQHLFPETFEQSTIICTRCTTDLSPNRAGVYP